jgi:transposase-like protein
LIRRWKVELEDPVTEPFPENGNRQTEQKGNHERESENRRLQMEREIIKKATALFTKQTACGRELFLK